MPTVIAILAEGFEEIEAIAPIDLLRRAGSEVIIAAVGPSLSIKGRSGIIISADVLLKTLEPRPFHCLLLPGGPHVKLLRSDVHVQKWINLAACSNLWIAAICAAPIVLNDLGLLEGKKYTAHTSVQNELPYVLLDKRVVVDGKLITSRGAGTSVDFGLSIIEHLISPEKALEVATSICA